MDAGDDIIDVLYKYRDSPHSIRSKDESASYESYNPPPPISSQEEDDEEPCFSSEYGTLESDYYSRGGIGEEPTNNNSGNRTYEYFPVRRSVTADVIAYRDNEELYSRQESDLITCPNGVRRRRQKILEEDQSKEVMGKGSEEKILKENGKCLWMDWGYLRSANTFVGVLLMLFIGHKWSEYLELLHENQTWFSNVSQLLREISFRTEQGLYYSYFKEFVASPSLEEGFKKLRLDNVTENTRTINIFHRFNVYQEVFLGIVYHFYDFGLEPIFFYIKSVFALQGILMMGFYLIAWRLSGTWVAGILTSAYVVCLRNYVTRVEYTIALREHFSLPFIFLQFAAVGYYMNPKPKGREKLHLVLIFSLSLLFTLSWQFSQFVLLLQSLVLFALGLFRVLDGNKATKVLLSHSLVILSTWYLQYYQPMVLGSLVFSFIPLGIFFLQLGQEPHILKRSFNRELLSYFLKAGGNIVLPLVLTIFFNMMLKISMDQSDDNHILHFIKSKLGFSDSTHFETRLYLCLSAFQAMPIQDLYAFLPNLSLVFYILFIFLGIGSLLLSIARRVHTSYSKKNDEEEKSNRLIRCIQFLENRDNLRFLSNIGERPEFIFHLGMSLVLGVLAISTYRMKCFWSPYILICGSAFLSDFHLWNAGMSLLVGKDNRRACTNLSHLLRHCFLVFLILHLYLSHKESLAEELDDLRELHDPDTVDLMQWIRQYTPPDAAFTGSMQLLAGVKLCTGRVLTNHPHFEDKDLRFRTKELYSIYSKISPEEVHEVLSKYDAGYIILEDSICMASPSNRCSLLEIMDLTNGFIPSDGVKDLPSLKESPHPLFCNEVRYAKGSYKKYFKEVFSNRTFRVYKVLMRKERQEHT